MFDIRNFELELLDLKINTAVAGKGPLILFLHGIGLSWQWWLPTLTSLSDNFSVCAIDLPGSGESSPLKSQPYSRFYNEFVTQLIELLDLGPAILVGHSLGGYVVAQAAIQRASGIKAIVLVAPAGFGPIHNIILRCLSIPVLGECLTLTDRLGGTRILLRSLVYNRKSVSDDMIRLSNVSSAAKQQFLYQLRLGVHYAYTSKGFLIKDAPPLDIPISLIWGKYDTVFPRTVAYQTQQILHAPPPLIFEHSGHFTYLEEPDHFNSVLRSFAYRSSIQ